MGAPSGATAYITLTTVVPWPDLSCPSSLSVTPFASRSVFDPSTVRYAPVNFLALMIRMLQFLEQVSLLFRELRLKKLTGMNCSEVSLRKVLSHSSTIQNVYWHPIRIWSDTSHSPWSDLHPVFRISPPESCIAEFAPLLSSMLHSSQAIYERERLLWA